ncbi:MAG: pilin [Patescibacteria group bacterium]
MKNKKILIALLFVFAFLLLTPLLSSAESASDSFKPTVPRLQIEIPTLQFSKVTKYGDAVGLPWLADYIAAIYKYAVGIVSLVAIIMIMVGGLRWMTAGGNSSAIGAAKDTITGAVVGLLLALGSYLVLYSINPDLVTFRELQVKLIQRQSIEYIGLMSDSEYNKVAGETNPGRAAIIQKAIQVAKTAGIPDPCMFVAIITKESGGNPGAIGHDENYQNSVCVSARRDFLMSGKKYSGATFTPPFTDPKEYNKDTCAKYNKLPILNDDAKTLDLNSPPNYGLDPRFSHGFGLGQMTIKAPFTDAPKLLSIEYTLKKSADLFKSNLKCASDYGYTGEDQLRAAYFAYAAGCGNLKKVKDKQTFYTNRASTRAMEHYNKCKNQTQSAPEPDPQELE